VINTRLRELTSGTHITRMTSLPKLALYLGFTLVSVWPVHAAEPQPRPERPQESTPGVRAGAEDPGKHLFILSGQSNMAGLRENVTFVPRIQAEFGANRVIVVKDAQGGQPIRRWLKGDAPKAASAKEKPGDLYDRLMAKVQTASGNQKIASVTFLWMQGERDAGEGNAKTYKASLQGLLRQLETDLGRKDIHFVIGRLSDFGLGKGDSPDWEPIRKIQVEVGEAGPRTAWVNTDDLNDLPNKNGQGTRNDLHYSKEGYALFGTRLAEAAIKLIKASAH
jgi:hypothetical protein